MKKKEIVVNYIKQLINQGQLRQGDLIPSEQEIIKALNISY